MDMEINVLTKALESAPLCGVPRKYRLWILFAISV